MSGKALADTYVPGDKFITVRSSGAQKDNASLTLTGPERGIDVETVK